MRLALSNLRWLAAALVLASLLTACDEPKPSPEPQWRVYAIEYGRTPKFRRATLVRGDKTGKTAPFAWSAWLVRGAERTVLVDTGFDDKALAKQWGLENYRTVPEGLAGLKLTPEQITDVVLTHAHWDHIGNVTPYQRARVWIQEREYRWASKLVSPERPSRGGIRLVDLQILDGLLAEGRLNLVAKGATIAPGIVLHDGGGHTEAIQWVEICTGGPVGTVVLASDTAYLYENVERVVPTGSTTKPERDRSALQQMRKTASRPVLVIPGHDPDTFKRFPEIARGVVEIR